VKGIWQWIRGHLWIVIFSALVLLMLPLGIVGSSMWNSSIREARQKAVGDDFSKLDQVRVNYVLDSVIPGTPKTEFSGTPNERITEKFREWRKSQAEDLQAMMQDAESINLEGHAPLLPGIFPEPPKEELTAKLLDFAKIILGDEQAKIPSIFDELLKAINAGSPPSAERVFEQINERRQREVDQLRTGPESQPQVLTQEQTQSILAKLAEYRMGLYQAGAREISVYADKGIFIIPKESGSGSSGVMWSPQGTQLEENPDLVDCFAAQWDYWVFRDVLLAVARANQDASGKRLSVDRSTVKRIERLGVHMLPIIGESALYKMAGEPSASGEIAPDFRRSITGRFSSKANQQYDVRIVQLNAIVSSERLPQLIEQINKTNFMTVTNVALEQVDPWADLELGFFYGNEPVIRAILTIETIWFRSWIVPLMPKDLRGLLGVAAKEGEENAPAAEGAEGATPPSEEGGGETPRGRRDNR
jgi:hypothetical protein